MVGFVHKSNNMPRASADEIEPESFINGGISGRTKQEGKGARCILHEPYVGSTICAHIFLLFGTRIRYNNQSASVKALIIQLRGFLSKSNKLVLTYENCRIYHLFECLMRSQKLYETGCSLVPKLSIAYYSLLKAKCDCHPYTA